MPSWNTSVASAGSEPGALPPMSVQCEIEMAKANSSPSTNTGLTTPTSL